MFDAVLDSGGSMLSHVRSIRTALSVRMAEIQSQTPGCHRSRDALNRFNEGWVCRVAHCWEP